MHDLECCNTKTWDCDWTVECGMGMRLALTLAGIGRVGWCRPVPWDGWRRQRDSSGSAMSAAAGASGVMCSAADVCGVCMYVQKGRNLKPCVMTTVNFHHCCKARKCEVWNHRSAYTWLADGSMRTFDKGGQKGSVVGAFADLKLGVPMNKADG